MKTFNKGDEVFSIHGQAGSYVARTSSGHLVEPIYDAEDDGPHYADTVTWREVFTTPPVERLHAEVTKIEATLNDARQALTAVLAERRNTDNEHQARLTRLKKHAHLSRVDDYIEGRITHFVEWSRYSDQISVKTFDQVMKRESRSELPLLVLYGGYYDREMRDTKWCMLSDGDSLKVIPCTSREEAMEKAQVEVGLVFAAWRTDPNGNYGHTRLPDIAAAALASGLVVPDDVTARVAEMNAEKKANAVKKARSEFERAQQALLIIEGVTA